MSKKRLSILAIALVLSLALLAACGGQTAPAAPAATSAPASDTAASDTAASDTTASDTAAPADTGGALSGVHTYVLVPGESTASYIVDEEFLSRALDKLGINAGSVKTVGNTGDVEGSITVDLDNSSVSDSSITVNLTGLTSDQSRRDNWLQSKGPQLGKFPEATFVPTAIENAPDAYVDGEEISFQLVGDLTIRDITQPVTFDVTATVAGGVLTGVAEAQMKLTDFGIDPPNFADTLVVADLFTIRIEFTAKEQ